MTVIVDVVYDCIISIYFYNNVFDGAYVFIYLLVYL